MLRLHGTVAPIDETITSDPYIPIDIKWEKYSIDPPFYWRAAPNDQSLIEIGIDTTIGRLCSFTVVQAEHLIHANDDVYDPPMEQRIGLPTCDVSAWLVGTTGNHFLDEAVPFQLHVMGDLVMIEFLPRQEVSYEVVNGRVRFGVNMDGELCYVCVVELTALERRVLAEY